MHRDIVPTQVQTAGTERTVGFDPVVQDSADDCFEGFVQPRKTIAEQEAQINALRAVIKLASIDCEARSPGKRPGQSLFAKEVPEIILNTSVKGIQTGAVAGKRLNFGQSLHDKAGVEMVNEIADSIHRVKP